MKHHFSLLNLSLAIFCFLFISQAKAQTTSAPGPNESRVLEEADFPQGMIYPMDSLLCDWKVKNYILTDEDCSTANQNPYFSDSVYIDRLARIPSVMEMTYNDIVRRYIDTYNSRLRNQVALMLSASNFYIPIFEEALDAYNLPLELKYLPIIESALKPSAVSRAGASGLWQFMIGTGKMYGLESNSLVDERRDPIKATWAAARYLKDLHNIYKDWNLVIAAYNCGPATVNKAIHRSGGKSDYWSIYNYLPKETRGYVPAFIAANYVMTYYCDHNICPLETSIPADTDTIQVKQRIHFNQIATVCDIDVDMIKSLNPQYKNGIIPGDNKPYTLRLPHNQMLAYINKEEDVHKHKANEIFTHRKTVAVNTSKPAQQAKASSQTAQAKKPAVKAAPSSSRKVIYHRIKRGESLSVIANKYNVTVNELKRWNRLRSETIAAGRQLTVYQSK